MTKTPGKSRREFVKNVSKTGIGLGIVPNLQLFNLSNHFKKEKVNIGFIGTGYRGRNHVNNLLQNEDVRCSAICDIDLKAIESTKALFEKLGHKQPKIYSSDENAFRQMLEDEELDGVIISTNWKWHTPMAIAAMENGVFTGVEVSGAFSVEECWQLVQTHERTNTELFFLENVCFRRDVMAVLNMVRDNLFGEILHCRGGYQHDLRHVKFDDGKGGLVFGKDAISESKWRTQHSIDRNGELYPTHGLGPILNQLDINYGNRLLSLSSFATKSRSLDAYVQKHPNGGKDHPYRDIDWKLGDIVTTQIATSNGETILLTHDTNSPRPYSLGFRTQGTKGLIEYDYYMKRIHIEDISPNHRWEDAQKYYDKYDHSLWKKYADVALNGGHGGMDYFLDKTFVEDIRNGRPATIDVYDGVAMKVITPLSENSIREGGSVQDIPDFTSGKWMNRRSRFAIGDDF